MVDALFAIAGLMGGLALFAYRNPEAFTRMVNPVAGAGILLSLTLSLWNAAMYEMTDEITALVDEAGRAESERYASEEMLELDAAKLCEEPEGTRTELAVFFADCVEDIKRKYQGSRIVHNAILDFQASALERIRSQTIPSRWFVVATVFAVYPWVLLWIVPPKPSRPEGHLGPHHLSSSNEEVEPTPVGGPDDTPSELGG